MKTNAPIITTTHSNTLAERIKNVCAMLTLSLLVLWMLPSTAQALNYTYTVNDDNTATITGYTGSGGNVTIPGYIYYHRVTGIADWAFQQNSTLTSVIVPNGVTNLGDGVFYYCTALTNVVLPNGITSLGDYEISGCSSLVSFAIPNGVTSIGSSVFSDDTALTSVSFPNGLTSIGDAAFSDCPALTSLTIPSSVTDIGTSVFSFCPNLTGICFLGDAPTVGDEIFESSDNVLVYYLPDTSGWSDYFGDHLTVLWDAQIQTADGSFGVQTNRFGFNITAANSLVIVVEACTDIANPVWSRIQTNTITAGSVYFSDPKWTNYPTRFYHVTWP